MSKEGEEILQIITLFRHGKRNSFLDLETNKFYSTDLCPENIETTKEKGRAFIKKYIRNVFEQKTEEIYIYDNIEPEYENKK